MSKIKLFVAVPSMGSVVDAQIYALRDLEKKYADQIEFTYPPVLIQRKFHDYARNRMAAEFLNSGCDILWFLDSDVVPPAHVLDLVVKHSQYWDLAGAPYPVFMTPSGYEGPQVVMCVYTNDGGGLHASKVPYEGTAFVDGLATGCLFIKRDVFAQLSQPYFEFKYDAESRCISEGEDLGFCKKVNDLGYKFFTDFSMVCKHYKTVDLLDVNNYAINYANQAVLAYDANIRPKIDVLMNKVKEGAKPKSNLILPDRLK